MPRNKNSYKMLRGRQCLGVEKWRGKTSSRWSLWFCSWCLQCTFAHQTDDSTHTLSQNQFCNILKYMGNYSGYQFCFAMQSWEYPRLVYFYFHFNVCAIKAHSLVSCNSPVHMGKPLIMGIVGTCDHFITMWPLYNYVRLVISDERDSREFGIKQSVLQVFLSSWIVFGYEWITIFHQSSVWIFWDIYQSTDQ